jgi:uncharacterized protein YutE (UPF0331/DUF86 family)
MDREVIEHKLESLRRCLQRVAVKCPSDPDTLGRDPDLQDIVTLTLTRAVQLCVDLGADLIADLDVLPPDTMGQTFDALAHAGVIPEPLAQQLMKAVGFRNIAVHHLSDFSDFAKVIAARLAR